MMSYMPYVNAVILTIICIFGLLGNIMSMVVFFRNSSIKTASTVFIFNLALADFLFLISLPMTIATVLLHRWVFGQVLCRAYFGLFGINMFASVYTLVLMSVDRFIAICCMRMKDIRTMTNSVISCVFIWILSVLLVLPLMMYADLSEQQCSVWWPSKDGKAYNANAFTYYTISTGFILPCTLIVIFYISIVVKINTQKSELTGLNKQHKKKRNQRVTTLVLVIIMAFIICWLPHWIIQMYIVVSKGGHNRAALIVGSLVTTWLYTFNSALNPYLYGFMSANFRKAVTKSCTCQPGQLRDGSQSRGLLISLGGRRRTDNNDVTHDLASRSPRTSIRTVSTLREQVALLEDKHTRICNHNLLTVI